MLTTPLVVISKPRAIYTPEARQMHIEGDVTLQVRAPNEFMGQARLFHLFDYRRAATVSHENYVRTRVWMRLTTALSRYEAAAAAMLHDFGQHAWG